MLMGRKTGPETYSKNSAGQRVREDGRDCKDNRFRERADYIVEELRKLQILDGDGYIGAIPNGKKILSEEEGATALEYGLLTALVALVMAGGAVILGEGLNTMFGNIGTKSAPIATRIVNTTTNSNSVKPARTTAVAFAANAAAPCSDNAAKRSNEVSPTIAKPAAAVAPGCAASTRCESAT